MTSQMPSENITLARIASDQSVITSKHAKGLTWVNKDWTNIRTLEKTHGENYVHIAITYLLKEAIAFIGHSLTSRDIVNYAEMFQNQWTYWSIDDVAMCLRNGITGMYGKSNKNFSYEILTEWANKFEDSRLDYLESPERRGKEDMDLHHRISPKTNEPMAIILPPHLKTAKEIDDHLNKRHKEDKQ